MSKLNILCKDFELTEALESYAQEKCGSLDKYLSRYSDVAYNLRLGKVAKSHNHGKIFYAEVSVHTAEKNFGGKVEAEDIYSALDLLRDEIAHNISHYNDKHRSVELEQAREFKEKIHSA